MHTGASGLEVLSEEECLALLAAADVGRVGVAVGDQPLVFPVNYVLDGRCIIVRTDVGTMLSGASLAMVAFEIDDFDAEGRRGWPAPPARNPACSASTPGPSPGGASAAEPLRSSTSLAVGCAPRL